MKQGKRFRRALRCILSNGNRIHAELNCDRFGSFMDAKVAWSRFIDGRKTFDGPGGTCQCTGGCSACKTANVSCLVAWLFSRPVSDGTEIFKAPRKTKLNCDVYRELDKVLAMKRMHFVEDTTGFKGICKLGCRNCDLVRTFGDCLLAWLYSDYRETCC